MRWYGWHSDLLEKMLNRFLMGLERSSLFFGCWSGLVCSRFAGVETVGMVSMEVGIWEAFRMDRGKEVERT